MNLPLRSRAAAHFRRLIGTLCLALFLHPSQQANAAEATGAITGRVRNMATGQYLNNARVALKGTPEFVYTDATGVYRLVNVPPGAATLEVFYTDLDAAQVSVQVSPGGSVVQDVELTSVARYGQSAGVVKLDPFVLAADKETDANALATNEQRFAANIKNVMSTDSIGDVLGTNVGEFLKFMPGITAEYSSSEIVGINIRGITGDMTRFSSDGAPLVNSNSGANRAFNMMAMSLNDISRIEVTKVPTPATPSDSLAGSVNVISKSAFERSKAEFRYGVSFIGNSENLYLKKRPDSNADARKWKIMPAVNFDYTLPITKDLGIVVTAAQSTAVNEQNFYNTNWVNVLAGTTASVSNPFLQSTLNGDGPSRFTKRNFKTKVDWRVAQYSVLSAGFQYYDFKSSIGSLNMNTNVGANATSTIAGGTPLSFSPTHTMGATGRGTVNISGSGQSYTLKTKGGNLNYRFDDGRWMLEVLLSGSTSSRQRRDLEDGHFTGLNTALIAPTRIGFTDLSEKQHPTILAFNNANQPVDLYDIRNYRITTGTDGSYDNKAGQRNANLNLRRRLGFMPFPASIQIGGAHRIETLDIRLQSNQYTYNGPDGNPATDEPIAPFLMQVYNDEIPYFGDRLIPWVSVRRAYSAWQENPVLFAATPAQQVASETARRTNSEWLQETVSSYYVQAEASLFENRLRVLTGVRFEETTDQGQGSVNEPNAVWVRNANGSFARDAANNRIRRPDAGAVGSMEQLNLVLREREHHVERSYDGYYPSVHLTCEITPNFLARAAYAKTYGRPNFNNIIPRSTINENNLNIEDINDPSVIRGTVTVRNPSLMPWTADNYDLSLEYYTDQGGLFTVGAFQKDITNFFGTAARLATPEILEEVGLDERYLGWTVSTTFNSGDARVSGLEINARQSLRNLGAWGRHFTLFGNGTKLRLEGNQQANFASFIPETANWGGTFNWRKFDATARWNYRGLNRGAARPAFGPDGFLYVDGRTTLDLSLTYHLTPRLRLEASAINVTNEGTRTLTYGSETPVYARQLQIADWGFSLGIGIKGSF